MNLTFTQYELSSTIGIKETNSTLLHDAQINKPILFLPFGKHEGVWSFVVQKNDLTYLFPANSFLITHLLFLVTTVVLLIIALSIYLYYVESIHSDMTRSIRALINSIKSVQPQKP